MANLNAFKKPKKSFDSHPEFYINSPRFGGVPLKLLLNPHTRRRKSFFVRIKKIQPSTKNKNPWPISHFPLLLPKRSKRNTRPKVIQWFPFRRIKECYRFKEFDHSSGWTLAVRLTHASRTVMEVTQKDAVFKHKRNTNRRKKQNQSFSFSLPLRFPLESLLLFVSLLDQWQTGE